MIDESALVGALVVPAACAAVAVPFERSHARRQAVPQVAALKRPLHLGRESVRFRVKHFLILVSP